jgi:DNA (cytosine-5)-methyltransferase 1
MPVKIGTDCSGMEAPIQAIRNLGINYEHKFSCDINEHARATIKANFPHGTMYEDLTKRDNSKVPKVDLYIAGFPCQPFSSAGLQQGFKDKKGRGEIFFHVLEFLDENRPKVFILENVSGITTLRQPNGRLYMDDILKELNGLKDYNIDWKVLDTKEQGIPQSRRRWYCVGIRKDVDNGSFSFPEKIACPKIDLLLESRKKELARSGLPPVSQSTARKNVKAALLKIRRTGHDGRRVTHLVDCDSSPDRSIFRKNMCPCITVSRAAGHWVTSRGRRTTKEEMMRLHGMNPQHFKVGVTENQLGRQLGNTMSVNVLERLFVRLLPAAKLVKRNEVKDRWQNGSAVRELMKTVGKGFAKKTVEAPSTPPRGSKRRARSVTPPPSAKRRAVVAAKSPRK